MRQATQEAGERRPRRALVIAAGNVLVVSGCVYLLARTVFLARSGYGYIDFASALLLLGSEAFVMFHSLAYLVDVRGAFSQEQTPRKEIAEDDGTAPSVAVMVPARHEPREVIENTFVCLENLVYPHKTIYLLDDSSLHEYQKEAEEVAAEHGAKVFRRAERHGAKAGIINDCLRTVDDKYVAILDCDQQPLLGFLRDILPYLEANPRLAFVQTPQFYTNADASPVAFAANIQHCIFYEYICEGKSRLGSMICCGTNNVIRREALLEVGGFDETSVTEDFSTSVEFAIRGWQSLYHDNVCVFGKGPESLGPYLKQQWRWARGNVGVLRKILRYLVTRPRAMAFWQWWDFLATGSYYLIGWAYVFLMLCPIAYVLFSVPSFFMEPRVYFLTFLPYLSFSMCLFYGSMKRRSYTVATLLKAQALGFVAIPVYMMASAAALLNLNATFAVTQKSRTAATPYRDLWPQIGLWLLNYAALVWGINRLIMERDLAVLMSLVWILYHFALLSSVFYFRLGAKALQDTSDRAPVSEQEE